jgi:hypothetical protein
MANVEDRQSCHQLLHLAGLGAYYHELDIAGIERAGTQGKEIKRDQLKSQSEQASDHRLLTWMTALESLLLFLR